MDERRTLERLKPYYYLRVYDQRTNEYVGSVFDISKSGLRLASERPFEKGESYGLRMLLPEDSILGEKLDLDANVKWCKRVPEDDSYHAGFELKGQVGNAVHVIEKLLSDLKKQDLL